MANPLRGCQQVVSSITNIPGVREPWGLRTLRILWATGWTPAKAEKEFGISAYQVASVIKHGKPQTAPVKFVKKLRQLERRWAQDLQALDAGEIEIISRWEWKRRDLRPRRNPVPGEAQRFLGAPVTSAAPVGEVDSPGPDSSSSLNHGPGIAQSAVGARHFSGSIYVKRPKMGLGRSVKPRGRIRLIVGGMAEVAHVQRQWFQSTTDTGIPSPPAKGADTVSRGGGEWRWVIAHVGKKYKITYD